MNNVGAISFGPTVDLLNNAVDGAAKEHQQIANNLANVNTPNYRRSTISFKEALAASLGSPANPDELALSTDDDRQFNISGGVAPVPYDPKPQIDETTQMRVDGSNVDLDQEMAKLEENSGYQETMAALVKSQYSWLRESIEEQTH